MKQLFIILFLFFSNLTNAQTAPVGNPEPKRIIVSKPNISNIESTENNKIVLKVTLNSEGIICSRPIVVRDKTTTADMTLINQVIDLVQKETIFITITISATEEPPIIP